MKLAGGLGHLTYSTLVHPADNWEQLWESLNRYLPAVKRRFSPNEPFGVCLRLSRASADTLTQRPAELARLKAFLAENDMYVFTANAFPYGAFKGERVKEQVYEPDWRTDERATYTMRVADILAALAPADIQPSIQSPPLGYKPRVTGPEVVEAYTRQLHAVVAYLADLEARTGRTVTLALEPEPSCYLELTSELIDYFANHLFSSESARALSRRTGWPEARCDMLLRKHLGAVYDICHQAVEYEDIAESLASLRKAGVSVLKLQPASALRIPEVTREIVEALRAFDDPIYLHQTIQRYEGTSDALSRLARSSNGLGEGPDPLRMAHSLSCACVPRRGEPLQDDQARHRSGAEGPQGRSALGAYRDRDLHMGRAAGEAQERRHRRLCRARA